MSVATVQQDILSVEADAVVLGVEMTMGAADTPVCARLAEAGGDALRAELRRLRFLPVGSAAAADPGPLPFSHLIVTVQPRWLTGKANELFALRRCYRSVYAAAGELGCRTLASPFLSASYYRFPIEEAIHIAQQEAREQTLDTVFVAGSAEVYACSQRPYRKPQIVSYVGYYRDHALFELDNGLFARIDLRPENVDVAQIPYFEACYRSGNNPLQPPLPEAEIERLRQIYEHNSW